MNVVRSGAYQNVSFLVWCLIDVYHLIIVIVVLLGEQTEFILLDALTRQLQQHSFRPSNFRSWGADLFAPPL